MSFNFKMKSTIVTTLYKSVNLRGLYYSFSATALFSVSRIISNELNNHEQHAQNKSKKGKVVVLKKIFPVNPKDPVRILETKNASDLMKQYNWENKQLYGPVQFPKTNIYRDHINEANQIIQHHTQLPIVEPKISSELNLNDSICEREQSKEIYKFDFDKILNFPLLNIENEENNDIKINELNQLRKYLESKCSEKLPSISMILEKTMPKENADALNRWKIRMIEKLGVEGFEKFRNEMLQNGISLHENINSYLAATPEKDLIIKENNLGHWKSLKQILPGISNVKLLEEKVLHPFLCYKGIVDCFAKYKSHLVVIDWKTSKRPKSTISSTYDNPLQIAAYVGALNFDPKFQYLVNKGLIVVAYESGFPGSVHLIEEEKMSHYWKEWLKRIKLYWEMKENSEN